MELPSEESKVASKGRAAERRRGGGTVQVPGTGRWANECWGGRLRSPIGGPVVQCDAGRKAGVEGRSDGIDTAAAVLATDSAGALVEVSEASRRGHPLESTLPAGVP